MSTPMRNWTAAFYWVGVCTALACFALVLMAALELLTHQELAKGVAAKIGRHLSAPNMNCNATRCVMFRDSSTPHVPSSVRAPGSPYSGTAATTRESNLDPGA